ncbi:MAG: M14 family zinc carboxypeptidase [Planctomycetota bacterium]
MSDEFDMPEMDFFVTPHKGWTVELVEEALDQALAASPCVATRAAFGKSHEGRAIELVEIGSGPIRVCAWSQMHGDEQTFTAVCLNLLRLLASQPQREVMAEILAGCRLSLIPMLNPDGAARQSRFNALGIDLNRDARRLASSESQLLHRLISERKPTFAFNLHNQSHRRWMPDGERCVSMALLVPPATPGNESTPSTIAAERVASHIIGAVDSVCESRVTRYGADYMPRAFGEWVQSTGASTVLLEAGGWPGDDVAALEHCCLQALIAGLHAIATDSYGDIPCDAYRQLPRCHEEESFDQLIVDAIAYGKDDEEYRRIDLGINRPNLSIRHPQPGGGVIADIGDLADHPRTSVLDAEGLLCLPGRTACLPAEELLGERRQEAIDKLLLAGVTTVLVIMDASPDDLAEKIDAIIDDERPDLDIGLVARFPELTKAERIAIESVPEEVLAVFPQSLPVPDVLEMPRTLIDWMTKTDAWVELVVGLKSCTTLKRGDVANLVLLPPPTSDQSPPEDLRYVLVGGTVVADGGEIVQRGAGRWLTRR